jgi:hypothetical protein
MNHVALEMIIINHTIININATCAWLGLYVITLSDFIKVFSQPSQIRYVYFLKREKLMEKYFVVISNKQTYSC